MAYTYIHIVENYFVKPSRGGYVLGTLQTKKGGRRSLMNGITYGSLTEAMEADAIHYPNMGTVKKAAEIYGLSPSYIRRLCKTGKIRYVNAGHMWLVNLDSLARYFEQGDPAENSQTVGGIRRVAR